MRDLIWVMLALILVGCGATGQRYSEIPTTEIGDGSEIIVFRKDQFVDGGSCYTVYVDDSEIGVLANGGFLRKLVTEGEHEVTIPHINDEILNIQVTVKAGSRHFFEYSSALAGIGVIPIGSVVATSVSFNNTFAEVKPEYALINLQDIKDSSTKPSCMATVRK